LDGAWWHTIWHTVSATCVGGGDGRRRASGLTFDTARHTFLLMQVTDEVQRSKASLARREQIIDATVATIAELGYVRCSFVEITKRAGLSSTRLISYHFENRDELMAQVASRVLEQLGAAVNARVRAADSPAAAVHAYVEANLGYINTHRAQMTALTELLFAGVLRVSSEQSSSGVEALTVIIDAACRAGQFREVDPRVAAAIVQRSVEGAALLLRDDPTIDLAGHAAELVRFFDAALAPSPRRRSTR
jgi:AcrR family transcriptional regulator